MAIRFDEIEFSGTANHYYPILRASGGVLKTETASGYIDIGPANSSYAHFTTDRPSFYFNNAVAFDGNITGYGTNETATFAYFINRNDSNAFLSNTTLVLRSGDPTIYMRDTDHRSVALHTNSNRFYVLGAPTDSTSYSQISGVWPWYVQLDTNNVYTGNIGYAGNSYRAPIFYDSNDTAYYVNPNGFSNFGQSDGPVMKITKTGASPGNNHTLLVENTYANHSWGVVGEFRIVGNSGTDKPAVLYSSGQTSTTWTTGFSYVNSNFGIVQDRGHRNSGWGNIRLEIDTSGNVTNHVSTRSPIFYSSSDTSYYLYPNSTSILYGLSVSQTISGTIADAIRLVREDNRTISPSEEQAGRLRFGFTSWANNNSSPYAEFLHMRSYTDASGGNDTLVMFKKSNPSGVRVWSQSYGSSTAYSDYIDLIDTSTNNQVKSGYIQSNASLRAPIFYDSGNTGYYADPNSSSRLHSIVVGDGTPDTTPDGTTFSNTIKSTGNNNRVVNFEGVGGVISTWYTVGNTAYGAIDQNTSYMSFWQNLGSGWQEQFRIYRGYQQSLNSLRAPLFYDSNDTGYYTDPSSISRMSSIWFGKGSNDRSGAVSIALNDGQLLFRSNTDYNHKMWYYDGINFSTNPSHGHIRFWADSSSRNNSTGGTTIVLDTDCQNINTKIYGQTHSPIYYDLNDTNYYLDPNTTGNSLVAAGKIIGSNINTSIKYLGTGVSYDTDRSTKVTDGIALYSAYNGGSNSPHTYDFSAQFVGSSRGFELSAAWHSQTALYIRTLRDCCQNWSSWYAIAIHGLNLGTTAGALYAGAFYDSGSTAYFNDMANTTLSSRQLGPSEFRTSAGNTRGYIQATDTNDQHFIIATSGGEDIAFKDGGLGGTTNMIIRGDGDVNVPGFITTPKIIVTTGSIASSDAGTKGLIIHGNYTDGRYAHRFRKQDLGGNVVLFLDQSGSSANSFSYIVRFGAYSGNSMVLETAGPIKANGDMHSNRLYDGANTTYYFDGADTGTAIRVAGDIIAFYSSDKRYKDNIKPIENSLDKINKIGGYTFEWNELSHKETGKKDVGVIAQEVEEVLPEVVETRSNGYKAVDYQKLTALLIESVKELKAEVEELKKQIK